MMQNKKIAIQILSWIIFFGILGYSIKITPIHVTELDPEWLLLTAMCASLVLLIQAAQLVVFMESENKNIGFLWSLWFQAEKAWLNTILPAKAGTASTFALLVKLHKVNWKNYLRFLGLCTALTAYMTAMGLLLYVSNIGVVLISFFASTFFLGFALKNAFNTPPRHFLKLMMLAALMLIVLSFGVSAAVYGLGGKISYSDTLAVGTLLNALSMVSITPGNFGFREAALGAASTFTTFDFSTVVQGSAVFVLTRLIISIFLATILRGRANQAP